MAFKMITINGYSYYEAVSAFQKAIRRCDEDETVFWGIELFESNFIPHLWNRIFIIAHEDIGLAEDGFTGKIIALKQAYDYLELKRPKKVSKRLVLLQTFILLARAKKSRYVDLAYSVYWSKHHERAVGKKVPDYAFDMHTQTGRKMKRGLDHFYDEGAKINNDAMISGEIEFRELAKQIDIDGQGQPEKPISDPSDPKLF